MVKGEGYQRCIVHLSVYLLIFAPSLVTEEQLSLLQQQSHWHLAGCLGKAFCIYLQATKGES